MPYVFLAMLIISCILYVYFYELITKKQIFIFKMSTSSFLLILGLYIFLTKDERRSYDYFVMFGLCSGFVGDLFLGFRNLFIKYKHLFFVIGIIFFMIGHIAYINAMFTLFSGNVIYLIILTLSLLAFAIVFTKKTKVVFGKTILICHTYTLLSSIFLSVAIFNTFRLNEMYIYVLLFGVISFVLSDFLLSYLYFSKISETKRKVFKRINIITYYVGQAILAFSIFVL